MNIDGNRIYPGADGGSAECCPRSREPDRFLINKTMDKEDLDIEGCIRVIEELNDLIRALNDRKLLYSSWVGLLDQDEGEADRINRGLRYSPHALSYDDARIPWFLYWEIAWVYLMSGVTPGSTVLDMGGCSSLFSYYLAHKGCTVYAVDCNGALVENADSVAHQMTWKMYPKQVDMRDMEFQDNFFDYVFSICVFEHILFADRIKIMYKVNKMLKPGGKFCITFDYQNPHLAMNINSPADVTSNFVTPGKLSIIGNKEFYDNGKRYLFHPWFYSSRELLKRIQSRELPARAIFQRSMAKYTFGALFCERA